MIRVKGPEIGRPPSCSLRSHNIARQASTLPDPVKVLQSFNTWSFKREQPSEPDQLLSSIASAISAQAPLEFVLYWGKGPRSSLATPDQVCLDYLTTMFSRIKCLHSPGVLATLIMTDTHAEHNGHATNDIESYFAAVGEAATARGFKQTRLKYLIRCANHVIQVHESAASKHISKKLEICAAKWYAGGGSVADGAHQYYRMNMLEKQAVQAAYPKAIFLTFNGSEYRELFPPALPVFYMYSLRKGFSVKPWFIDHDEQRETRRA